MIKPYILLFSALLIASCGGGSGGGTTDSDSNTNNPTIYYKDTIETQIRSDLDNYNSDTDFTLLVKSSSGNTFSHSTGSSTESTSYRSASTSKMVTAAVILNVVKSGSLDLNSNPQDFLNFWPTAGNLSNITLSHLLSFTSGLINEPICINIGISNFESCVENILSSNDGSIVPGTEFYYSSTHLQVAGLMAVEAAGVDSWETLFSHFKTETGLFTTSIYDLPSTTNPRLAGGMHWTAAEYLQFLEAIYEGTILTPELITSMTSDQFQGATIAYSPALDGIGKDWHYGFGTWIECDQTPFNCTSPYKASSAGAYGAYPFIDFENQYFGILAREGALGTFDKGFITFEVVEDELKIWASL